MGNDCAAANAVVAIVADDDLFDENICSWPRVSKLSDLVRERAIIDMHANPTAQASITINTNMPTLLFFSSGWLCCLASMNSTDEFVVAELFGLHGWFLS